ncbi:MAG: S8 family serine peptidase [Alphaproteobacteria bacterium]|nr:S8 family serine peptidase [Alphaproteobacteria bacterium]
MARSQRPAAAGAHSAAVAPPGVFRPDDLTAFDPAPDPDLFLLTLPGEPWLGPRALAHARPSFVRPPAPAASIPAASIPAASSPTVSSAPVSSAPVSSAPGGIPAAALPAPAAPITASTAAPRTDDNSDLAVHGNVARSTDDLSGAGIKIGILSDSFNLLGGMAADIADGDLPANTQILEDGASGHDEGRAMAELVHRIAPDAQILFHTATVSEADFAAGITALVQAGCQIIVDDVAWLDEPFFQDAGAVDTAIENAIASGVSYFTAAGNEGSDFIQEVFAPMRITVPGLPAGAQVQNFGTAALPQPWLDVTIPAGGTCLLDLQWDQPYGDAGDSLGMALFDAAGNLVAQAAGDAVGGNPDQLLEFVNSGSATQYRLVLYANGGSEVPGTFKIISYGNGTIADPNAGQGSGTVMGHEILPGVNTVGAVAWYNTAAFGGSNTVESFSSEGTGTFLFGPEGTPLASPQAAGSVDFLAPDGSVTSVFAPFYGTSAAAPDAAAVAALVLQADPALTPAQVTQVLEASAIPASGATSAVGAGLIQADTAVSIALGLAHGSG